MTRTPNWPIYSVLNMTRTHNWPIYSVLNMTRTHNWPILQHCLEILIFQPKLENGFCQSEQNIFLK